MQKSASIFWNTVPMSSKDSNRFLKSSSCTYILCCPVLSNIKLFTIIILQILRSITIYHTELFDSWSSVSPLSLLETCVLLSSLSSILQDESVSPLSCTLGAKLNTILKHKLMWKQVISEMFSFAKHRIFIFWSKQIQPRPWKSNGPSLTITLTRCQLQYLATHRHACWMIEVR